MQEKLVVLFMAVLLAFALLLFRLYQINRDNGERYKKQVLSQQSYDSRELPYKRGTITDAKGTVLATSELVYNVILDSYQINSGKDEATGENKYLEPTMEALQMLGCDVDAVRSYVHDNPGSRYYIVRKQMPYQEYAAYKQTLQDASDLVSKIRTDIKEEESGSASETKLASLNEQLEKAKEVNGRYQLITGIWFEENYIRSYPMKTLASQVIGFVSSDNQGSFGLEEYYNDTLNGTPGREYGYLSDTSSLERTIIPATDGNNLELTIDANIQSICEKYLLKFNEEHENHARQGDGANNVGVIIQNINNGEILAMAGYPNYDLSDPYNMNPIVGMPKLKDKDTERYGEDGIDPFEDTPLNVYMTQEDVDALEDYDQQSRYLNQLWSNFTISSYYEPGSTAKPFTLAAGLESGHLHGDETYFCGGSLNVGGWPIRCHNTNGDGILNLNQAIERSCNVALMQMAAAIGTEDFAKFQRIFNFGLKTNIDLAGEVRTDGVIISADKMSGTDLATNSFGQNFDVTMIQMITAFSSLVNGGNYYEPHVVSKITSSSGATVKTIEPRLIKKTVSEQTSEAVKEATLQVVEGDYGTGKKARPAGYRIGGKTGTAETFTVVDGKWVRDEGRYVISFIGYAPYEDPQVAIYVVINRLNEIPQDQTGFACLLAHDILTEVLPYMGIYMTVPLTETEEEQLAALNLSNTYAYGAGNTPIAIKNNWDADGDGIDEALDVDGDGVADVAMDTNGDGVTDAVDTNGDGVADWFDTDNDGKVDSQVNPNQKPSPDTIENKPWLAYERDPATGFCIDPKTGDLIDPETGYVYNQSYEEQGAETTTGGATPAQGQTAPAEAEAPAPTEAGAPAEEAPAGDAPAENTPAEGTAEGGEDTPAQ